MEYLYFMLIHFLLFTLTSSNLYYNIGDIVRELNKNNLNEIELSKDELIKLMYKFPGFKVSYILTILNLFTITMIITIPIFYTIFEFVLPGFFNFYFSDLMKLKIMLFTDFIIELLSWFKLYKFGGSIYTDVSEFPTVYKWKLIPVGEGKFKLKKIYENDNK